MQIDDAAVLLTGPDDAEDLLVLLHGRGADEHDLLPLAERLGVPDRVAALRGPVPWQGGRAWAAPTPNPLGDTDLVPAAEAVLAWLDRAAAGARRVRLLGFSQGAAVVLELLRSAPNRFASAVVLSGFVPGTAPSEALARRRPPVFSGHGAIDPVIPASALGPTRAWLEAHTALEAHEYPMLGHGVSDEELADVAAFLARDPGGRDPAD